MLKNFCLAGGLGLLVVVCTGCGPAATSSENPPAVKPADSPPSADVQSVTFRVSEMGKRLKLL